MVNKVTQDNCLQRERERVRKGGGEENTEIVQLVAQSAQSLFILFLSAFKIYTVIYIYIYTVPGQVKTEYTFHTYLLIPIRI